MRIGIIGPTGAGKTLLAKKLAAYYHAKVIEQAIEKNEYLPHFYKDKENDKYDTWVYVIGTPDNYYDANMISFDEEVVGIYSTYFISK